MMVINSGDIVSIITGEESSNVLQESHPVSEENVTITRGNVSEGEKQSYVIDMKCASGGGSTMDWDKERVCRICHLSSEGLVEINASTSRTDLIRLGCGCKNELGIAHAYCAEAWFKVKGKRICEICGKAAQNITGVGTSSRFMEDWIQWRYTGTSSSSSDRGTESCWRRELFCYFLMACLVIAFVFPWFLRMDML
ncbi:hypothetical protein JCGZ_09599 [Jatropha curcas]|uniref:RING-CH-type domain-containing protein n=1 Tax=Jatropha curcas TaxID=180498 RepID=A0A067LKW2_JATCU|nr:hypothetical protein JCGZ_09599 [Jatropha curcas]